MMSSDKLTVRLNEEKQKRLDREELNKSGLIRSLLDNYFRYADTVEAGLPKQFEDLPKKI